MSIRLLPCFLCMALGMMIGAGVPWCLLRLCHKPGNPWGPPAWQVWACSLAGGALAWGCVVLGEPSLGRDAILYTGLGAVLGQGMLLRQKGEAAVCGLVCVWVVLYLPFTGVLACLGAACLALAIGHPALGLVAAPVFAAPIALLQFGAPGALAMLAGAVVSFACCGGLEHPHHSRQ